MRQCNKDMDSYSKGAKGKRIFSAGKDNAHGALAHGDVGIDRPLKIWLLKKLGCSAEIDRLMVFHRIMEDMRTKEHAQMFRARYGY
jgi:hypothetical protein